MQTLEYTFQAIADVWESPLVKIAAIVVLLMIAWCALVEGKP